MKKAILFGLAGFFALTVGPVLADEIFSLKTGYIRLNPNGNFSLTSGGIEGTTLNLDKSLGLGKSNTGNIEAAFHIGDLRLGLEYLPIRSSGKALTNSSVQFGNDFFPAGTSVKSRLECDIVDLGMSYYLLNFDDLPSRLQLGLEAGVKVIRSSVGMESAALGISQQKSATIPIPVAGLRGRMALMDFIGITGQAKGFSYSGNRFIEADAQVEFSPLPGLGLYMGYRYIDMKVDHAGVFVDASFSGPVAGAFFRF